eukprot:3334285-Amphidinium_carterae.2
MATARAHFFPYANRSKRPNAWQSLAADRSATSRNTPSNAPPSGEATAVLNPEWAPGRDEVWDDEEDWDCPGLGWDFEVDLEDHDMDGIADDWYKRPSPSKRGREDPPQAQPREGVDQAMLDLRMENERLRKQIETLLQRIDQMCSMMQSSTHGGPGGSCEGTGPVTGPAPAAPSAAPVMAQAAPPTSQGCPHAAPCVSQGIPAPTIEQVPAHLYQITLEGEDIAFPVRMATGSNIRGGSTSGRLYSPALASDCKGSGKDGLEDR